MWCKCGVCGVNGVCGVLCRSVYVVYADHNSPGRDLHPLTDHMT